MAADNELGSETLSDLLCQIDGVGGRLKLLLKLLLHVDLPLLPLLLPNLRRTNQVLDGGRLAHTHSDVCDDARDR